MWPSWRMFGLFDEHDNTQLASSLSLAACGPCRYCLHRSCTDDRAGGCWSSVLVDRGAGVVAWHAEFPWNFPPRFSFSRVPNRLCAPTSSTCILGTYCAFFGGHSTKVCLVHVCMYAPVFCFFLPTYQPAHDIIRRVRSTHHCGEIAFPPEAGKSIMWLCTYNHSSFPRRAEAGAGSAVSPQSRHLLLYNTAVQPYMVCRS